MTDLEDGFYWVRVNSTDDFETAYISRSQVFLTGMEEFLPTYRMAEIDPRRIMREGGE